MTINSDIQALWHESGSHSALRNETVPNESLIAVEACYSMVSTGTERLVASGQLDGSFQDKMQVQHQQGDFTLPIKYGYSLVGYTPQRRLVHLMHPHQNIAFASAEQLFEVPADVSPQAATLISNMETVVNALWDAELFFSASAMQQQRVAIVGFGNIGALLAVTLRKCLGVAPIIVEADDWRSQKAMALGFEVSRDSDTNFNLLFHSTGQEVGLQWCLNNAQTEGVIVDLSWYGSQALHLELGREFHYQRLRLVSSQVSQIPGHKSQESYLTRKQYCAQLLADPIYLQLISHVIPFTEAPEFFMQLRHRQLPDGLIWLLAYASQITDTVNDCYF